MILRKRPHMKTLLPAHTALLAVGLALLLGACGTSPSVQEVEMPDLSVEIENPNRARIYLFRNDQEWGTTHFVTIYQEGARLGMIGEEDFFCWEYHPGRTSLSIVIERSGLQSGTKQGVATIDLVPGMILYGQIEFPVERRRPHILWLSDADGREEIAKRKPAPRAK